MTNKSASQIEDIRIPTKELIENYLTEKRIVSEKEFHNRRFHAEFRQPAWKFYSIDINNRKYFKKKLLNNIENKKVLEIGCGRKTYAFDIAEHGGDITGIDISDVAIEQSKQIAEGRNLSNKTNFLIMNAEEMLFADHSFDRITGVGILHHLNFEASLSEIARVLRKEGNAIFIEPLGHNFFINLYRRFTQKLRTKDEHPLKTKDLSLLTQYFGKVEIKYYHLTTLAAVMFRKSSFFLSLLKSLESIDRLLFKIPFIRRQAWQVVITLSEPIKN
jgi:ubiquinone/menaquinone biosynthesis C-methylase UbiE